MRVHHNAKQRRNTEYNTELLRVLCATDIKTDIKDNHFAGRAYVLLQTRAHLIYYPRRTSSYIATLLLPCYIVIFLY